LSSKILAVETVLHVVEEAVARAVVVDVERVVAVVVAMLLVATVPHAVMRLAVLLVVAVAVPAVLTLPTTALSQASANKQPNNFSSTKSDFCDF